MKILNYTEGGYEQVLFIVDSSQNIGEATFYRMELNFVKVITEVLFSRISFFGLTTYNDVADVVIPLDEYQSSEFIQRVDDVQYSPRDGSDMANVLDRSFSDIRRSRRRTLVVLISGTESTTNGSAEARLIKTRGNFIFPVVVGEVNRNTAISISSVNEEGSSLYFVFQNWESFSSTIVYISENYKTTTDANTTPPTGDETTGSGATTGTTGTTQPTSGENSDGVERISDEFLNILNYTEGGYEQVLFIVDSSQNVGEATFYRTELYFIKVITEVIFSRISYFGLTTYSGTADNVVPLAEYGRSGFIQRVDDVQYSPSEGSDMANVLDRSYSDILRSGRRTLIVLISGTESSTDGSGEARLIRSSGNIIIPVVVGEESRNTATSISSTSEEGSSLYFLFQSWEIFTSTVIYIKEKYGTTRDSTDTSEPTEHTTSSGGTTSDANHHSTEIPTTTTPQEIGDEFLNLLNSTEGDFEQVLFIVDSSQNVGEATFSHTELNFVKVITEVLFSRISFFGLTTYNDVADVVIPLDEYQSSEFIQRVDDVQYSSRDGSDMANVLDRSFSDIRRSRRRTLVVLISGTESSTNGSGEARLIQARGNIIIPVIVGEAIRNAAISISSVNEEGSSLYFVFQSWEIFSSTIVYISENYRTNSGDISTSTTHPTGDETTGYETTSPGTTGTTTTTPPPTSTNISVCDALENIENGHWSSSSCTEESSAEGTVCQLVCASGYDLSGDAEVTCSESGWGSSDGDIQLPACLTLEERSSELVERLNHSLQNTSNLLIVLDESWSVGQDQFTNIQLAFFNFLLNFISLTTRSIGVITYSDTANVVISLGKYQRSVLQERMSSISYEQGGVSNIEMALEVVTSEIQRSEVTGSTLVLLVSTSKSSTDGSSQARQINNNGGVIFPLVVGSDLNRLLHISSVTDSEQRTFFKFTSWESFSSILSFINESYETTSPGTTGTTTTPPPTSTNISVCDALESIENGHWSSSSCTEESSAEGTVCQLVCASGYDLSGDAEVTCSESGWGSSDGDIQLPACLTLEERSSELVERLNHSLQNTSNLLIVLDESWSVGQDQFTNIQLAFFNILLNFISLTTRSIGVITYSDTANVVISLGKYQRSVLQERMSSISYEQGGVSNIEMALEVVTSEIQRSEVTGSTLILLVSTSKSSTDGSSQARQINNNGGVIFPLVVGSDLNRLLYISSVTESEQRTFFKFTSWESFSSILSFINESYETTSPGTTGTTTTPPPTSTDISGIEEVGEEVVSVFNGTFTGFQQVLFIVDSSRNVGESAFYNTELNFVKIITEVVFSRISYFGLITYSDYAEVVIPFTEIESAEFIQRVDSVQYSPRDGSDIANVLDRALSNIRRSGWRTLVVFISGTESSIDGSGEARLIKSRGHFIIPIYVGEVNRDTAVSISSTNEEGSSVYFLFQNWGIFNAITTYISQNYIPDSRPEIPVCEALENSQRGYWEATNCSSGTSELGTICELVCEEGYELSCTPEVICNQSGWVSYRGDRMPSCKTIEEIGEDFIANINRTLGRPANLMFVVDGSGSLTEDEFGLETGLVNAIVRAFPLSEDRSAGVVTFSSDATVDVSVSTDDTCTFLSNVSAIRYPRGGTNLAKALQLANNELQQNAVHDFTVTFLITDGISITDPTEPAAILKRGDNPLFAIGVGDYDVVQLTSIATYFYPIRDFGIFNSLKNVLETDYANRTNVQC
ncbi:mucin-22 isoform X2 [Anabrus simplex]|uniref:mucin-22 isoform X2 n=1 Tax=Anabrus simplex TaxID=316456 RepID=UPI0035A2C26E